MSKEIKRSMSKKEIRLYFNISASTLQRRLKKIKSIDTKKRIYAGNELETILNAI